MNDEEFLAARFQDHRPHLRTVAYRLLGSDGEAEDAVQEAWLRVSRSGADEVENLPGWLTTIVARVALNMLKSRASRREGPLEDPPGTAPADDDGHDPEGRALLADSVGLAMLVVLDTLTPAERLAFVLHDVFSVPFDEIAHILERNPVAVRQLASRARRRVQGASPTPAAATDPARHRHVVGAFLLASRQGDLSALISVLHPDVVMRADRATVDTGVPEIVRGAADVAGTFSGRAQGARLAVIDGAPGLVWARGGRPRVVFDFTVTDGRITMIELISDPGRITRMDIRMT